MLVILDRFLVSAMAACLLYRLSGTAQRVHNLTSPLAVFHTTAATFDGAPQCTCIEDMPVVSKADCTRLHELVEGMYQRCPGNNLRRRYELLHPSGGGLDNLVKNCDNYCSEFTHHLV